MIEQGPTNDSLRCRAGERKCTALGILLEPTERTRPCSMAFRDNLLGLLKNARLCWRTSLYSFTWSCAMSMGNCQVHQLQKDREEELYYAKLGYCCIGTNLRDLSLGVCDGGEIDV